MLRTATEEPQINLAQTIASNLEAVIDPAAVLAQAIDQVAVPVQVIVPAVARAQVIDPAAERAQAIVPAAARAQVIDRAVVRELAIGQAEEVLARSRPRGQLAVPAKTKSVTALHRHDLAAALRVEEDLAVAVAETTHERAAAEAATVWEAAE